MHISTKIKLINNIFSIFDLKLGKIVQNRENKKCYRVPELFSKIYSFYFYGGVGAFVYFIIFLLLPNIFDSIVVTLFCALIIYISIEFLFVLLLPFREVKCWEKNFQEQKN